MYRLHDFFQSIFRTDAADIPSDELCCTETDTEITFYTNKMQDSLAAYTFTLVEQGWLNLTYNGRLLTLKRGDLYIIAFMRLLPKHFAAHHDIGFYASQLFITSTHLSRIVRQIKGVPL